jgi:hypothetical protein
MMVFEVVGWLLVIAGTAAFLLMAIAGPLYTAQTR